MLSYFLESDESSSSWPAVILPHNLSSSHLISFTMASKKLRHTQRVRKKLFDVADIMRSFLIILLPPFYLAYTSLFAQFISIRIQRECFIP